VAYPAAITFVEVGPRDGLQNLPTPAPTPFKVELIQRLFAAGLRRVEATSFVHPRRVPQLADAEAVLAALPSKQRRQVRVLVPHRTGLERAHRAGIGEVLVNVGATETFNQKNLNRSVEATLEEIASVCRDGHAAAIDVEGSISVAFGCPYEGEVKPQAVVAIAERLAAMGIPELSIADTIGIAHPRQVSELFGRLRERLPGTRLAAHFHDTRGMALANTLAALEAGVTTFEGSVGGIGGCPFAPGATGNVASEDLLNMVERMGIHTGVDIDKLVALARWAGRQLQRSLPGRLQQVPDAAA
jgi:hydroxymethylglutaryl-CoA lyase